MPAVSAAPPDAASVRAAIAEGRATLGIELGSTRIKASLIGEDFAPIASGSHEWENELVDGVWTYGLDAVWSGLRSCYADLLADVRRRHGVAPGGFAAIGVSAMMHGYLAFDADGELLVPFRTWRNTSTGPAAAALSAELGVNIPLRWSVAHLYQAVLDDEPHLRDLASLTTLAGYVHRRLTGRAVLGVGDASGMFPIDPATGDYDRRRLERVDRLVAARIPSLTLSGLLPEVLPAGVEAGRLTEEGAALLDPSGELRPGIPFCPPEGDAATGMVATNSVVPRTGNVSVGTSVFAMVVLQRALASVHSEVDIVATPAGDPVAMVHCNNGASELGAWAGVFGEFATALGAPAEPDDVFRALLTEAMAGDADGAGLLAYNHLSGEPIVGLEEGRPLIVRAPDSRLTLANLMRVQVYSAFATLSLGMRVLAGEGVEVDELLAHGGLLRTPGPAQRLLAASVGVPVAVESGAGEGGPWGMALLAAYLRSAADRTLGAFLVDEVFAAGSRTVVAPDPADRAGFLRFLDRYQAGLALERQAPAAVPALSTASAPTASAGRPVPVSERGSQMSETDAAIQRTREQVCALHAELTRYGLVVWTGGNVSGRVPGADLFVIKPSGVSYDELTPENMILCDLDGNVVPGAPGSDRSPSSDTAAHAYVYRSMPQVGGVVHTHSSYATAWAARAEPIPCVITAMADEFGGEIPVGPFAIIGDDSIGRGIVATLTGHRSRAVLMRNHGVFTIGKDARDAVKAAVMTEDVARTVHISRQLGEPLAIPQESVDALFDRYQNVYGQQPEGALR